MVVMECFRGRTVECTANIFSCSKIRKRYSSTASVHVGMMVVMECFRGFLLRSLHLKVLFCAHTIYICQVLSCIAVESVQLKISSAGQLFSFPGSAGQFNIQTILMPYDICHSVPSITVPNYII